jgi:outer membrane protein OmpA-like peptidoglycan-associated protein
MQPPPATVLQTIQPQAPVAQRGGGPQAPVTFDPSRRIDDVRSQRHEVRQGNQVFIQEPGRVIIREGDRTIIRHNEVERFTFNARDYRVERRGHETITVVERPDGSRIITVTDEYGRLIRRTRQGPDRREIVIIDNRYRGPAFVGSYYVDLPPPVIRIPRERYIVEAERATPAEIYAALMAPPVEPIERAYTLDEIRYSPRLLERMPRVDIDTITFDSGSWQIGPDQLGRLAVIADGIKRAVAANPAEVFLIEGHTDAVGSDVDNLSLSDRRAESVAIALTEQFQVPPENLTTQGYGEQYLKVPTLGPERANRRVTVRRITPLLAGQNQPGG